MLIHHLERTNFLLLKNIIQSISLFIIHDIVCTLFDISDDPQDSASCPVAAGDNGVVQHWHAALGPL